MSTKNTLLMTNDKGEHFYKDSAEVCDNGTKYGAEALTLEFNKDNIRIDCNNSDYLILTITGVNSEIYKIFEQIGKLATKEQK